MYCVSRNQTTAAYSSLYFFIFLSLQFSNIKLLVAFSQELWGLQSWKLIVNSGWMYRAYLNQAAAAYLSLYFFKFLSLQFSDMKIVVTFSSGNVRPTKLKLGTHMDNRWMCCLVALFSGTVKGTKLKLGTHVDSGWMYRVYRNQTVAAYSFPYSFFLSLQFSNIKNFRRTSFRNCDAYKAETWYTRGQWMDVSPMPNQAAATYLSFISSYFFLSNFQTLNF